MLTRAAKELTVELERSVMVGDRCSDIAAANAAGLRQAFLLLGTEMEECAGDYRAVTALHEVQEWLVVAAAASADEVCLIEGDSSRLSDDEAAAKMGHPNEDEGLE
jgi:histidinol phosphatase-like enzyme